MGDDVQLPKEHDAERYCIGCLVTFPDRAGEVFERLTATDFFDLEHQKIFAAAARQHAAGGIDRVLLGTETGTASILFDLGIDPHNAPGTGVHIASEAAKIIEARKKRQRYDELQRLAEHSLNGYASEHIDQQLEAALHDWKRERESKQEPHSFIYRDLKSVHPTLNPIVIDGIARQGETVNLIAPSKFGKSWLLHYILLCIVTGRYIFGRFATSAGKCILIDNELHAPTLVHRITSVAEAMGIKPNEYGDNLIIWPLRGKLPSLLDLHSLILELEPGEVKAIGYDAMYRFLPAGVSENDNGAMKEIYNSLDAFARHTKGVNIVIHHSSKGDQSGKAITDVGAGAGSQSRAADTHLVLRQHEEPGIAVLESAIRSFAPIEPLPLRWAFPLWIPADDVDPAKLKGRLTHGEQRQSDKDREGVEKIIKALSETKASARALREKTGIGKDRQQRLLDWMVAEGHATATEIINRGNPTREYSLVKDTE